MKKIKGLISIILALTLICGVSVTAFAASGFHKVNGTGSETGQSDTYYSTTWKDCRTIKAQGTSDSNGKRVEITVQANGAGGKVVASGSVILDGTEQVLDNFYTTKFKAGTYYITVTSSDTVGYEVSTYFYE